MTLIWAKMTAIILTIGGVLAIGPCFAQELKFDAAKARPLTLHMIPWYAAISKIEKTEGYYTYKVGGALGEKVISPINSQLAAGKVQFKYCNGVPFPVDESDLIPVGRECPKEGHGGTWLRKIGDALVPVPDAEKSSPTTLSGKKIDLSTFPVEYQNIFAKAKNGELVGYSTPSGSGDLTLSVLTKHQM